MNDAIASKLTEGLSVMLEAGSSPVCCRHANMKRVPKDPISPFMGNNFFISIASMLSKVYERLVALRLGSYFKHYVCLLIIMPERVMVRVMFFVINVSYSSR